MRVQEHNVEVIMIITASMTTILALILSFNYPELQILILTILTILLPVIYQVGHIYSKELIKEKNEQDFLILEHNIEFLESQNNLLKQQINKK
ncbi:hypothetical protein HOD75_01280 [archaeon]|jgi:hypothetical protein|nr:hypothetical protein [archaeon]MBT4241510.1 hypothetical protein [archaeon]MBT4417619.1 hypothetical protein [archaeon]